MNIDFHHGVTYVVARLAGFSAQEAEIVAYSAQYVDDAMNTGEIHFENGMMYARISSAHKALDYRNATALVDRHVWLPFHFLPGNSGLDECALAPADGDSWPEFSKRSTCRADSPLAQAMVKGTIVRRDRPYALHRLGIAMHVYADTWAHQGFVGFMSAINIVRDLGSEMPLPKRGVIDRILDLVAWIRDSLTRFVADEFFPVGHGTALNYPDLPYLRWHYTNGLGEHIERDNPYDFGQAARKMFVAMARYRCGDADAMIEIPDETFRKIDHWLASIADEDAETRHQRWLEMIRAGEFGFSDPIGPYIDKGVGSWKYAALGTARSVELFGEEFRYHPAFLDSNWKHFHDALQVHRLFVLNELLPTFGLCAA